MDDGAYRSRYRRARATQQADPSTASEEGEGRPRVGRVVQVTKEDEHSARRRCRPLGIRHCVWKFRTCGELEWAYRHVEHAVWYQAEDVRCWPPGAELF